MCKNFLDFRTPYLGADEWGTCAGFHTCYLGCPIDDPHCLLGCALSAGDACYGCAFDQHLNGSQAGQECPISSLRILDCYTRCDTVASDPFGCLLTECASEYEQYLDCWNPAFWQKKVSGDMGKCDIYVP